MSYLRAFRYLGRFRIGEDFRAWLYRITVNVCHDFARKRRLTEATAFDELAADLGVPHLTLPKVVWTLRASYCTNSNSRSSGEPCNRSPKRNERRWSFAILKSFSTEQVARALRLAASHGPFAGKQRAAKIKTYCENLTRRRSAS